CTREAPSTGYRFDVW
nr:immunoglobulin heavy chain junction region [Macaca mulatta]MOW20726.1 immunoglobulin heavy chain junction region [Macaca mulatta]